MSKRHGSNTDTNNIDYSNTDFSEPDSFVVVNNNENEQAVFIDFDGHCKDENVQEMLKDLEPNCKSLRVIGSYTRF